MPNDTEPIVIDDEDIADVPGLPTPKDGETVDWEAQAKMYQGMATRRGTKLSKLKGANAKPPETPPAPAADQAKKGELDYGQKAFLNSLGFKHADEHKFVQKMITDSGQDLDTIMSSPYVQSELKRMGEERSGKEGMPDNGGRSGGASAKDTVDYWLKAGGLPQDNPELSRKVVNERIKQRGGASQFSSTPVVGG